ncbi:MAG: metallophosphoesterase [Pseudomonadota bacterium]|uniref:metallophosphoesterase n=1 Tax=Hylemonella sp. TaxID=2066020 RepID=UPI0035B01E61
MKLLVLSDLHNEASVMSPFVDGRRIDTDADVVVLAGDIHEGVQAPIWSRQAFPDKEIILVAGNHEFYGRYWKRNLRKIREKSAQLGIHFLENDAVEIGGIRFLGCTLWTDYCLYGEERRRESMNAAHTLMTDFRLIKLDRKPDENQDWREFRVVKLIPQLTLRRHVQSAAWLDAQLALGDPDKTVVVTHHAPLGMSIPKQFQGDKLSPAYASNLLHLVGRSELWIHGHVHESMDYRYGKTRVVCNPRGYQTPSGEHLNGLFQPVLIVEI